MIDIPFPIFPYFELGKYFIIQRIILSKGFEIIFVPVKLSFLSKKEFI